MWPCLGHMKFVVWIHVEMCLSPAQPAPGAGFENSESCINQIGSFQATTTIEGDRAATTQEKVVSSGFREGSL